MDDTSSDVIPVFTCVHVAPLSVERYKPLNLVEA
jgi:hypothetical protein